MQTPHSLTHADYRRFAISRKRKLKASVKALYQLDPILWAIVRGHNTDQALTDRFPKWRSQRLTDAIALSIQLNHITPDYRLIKPEHIKLQQRWARLG